MTGLRASTSARAAASTSRGLPAGRLARALRYSGAAPSSSAPATSAGISTITGPGLPILSRLKARRITFDIWAGTVTSSTHLVTEA